MVGFLGPDDVHFRFLRNLKTSRGTLLFLALLTVSCFDCPFPLLYKKYINGESLVDARAL